MRDWEKAGAEEIVCLCCKATKYDVLEAIADGAETVEQVMEKIGMKCGAAQESKENIQALLDTYLAAVKNLKSG